MKLRSIWHGIERGILWFSVLVLLCAVIAIGAIVSRPPQRGGNQATFAGVEQQKKRLVIYLDGTWNSVNSNTNVWRMRALTASKSLDGRPQLIYYEIGVNGFLGGVFGQGLTENIRLAYEWLIENYSEGDEIYIFGFSRGAFTARSLAGLISIVGILKAGSPISITELFDRYKRSDEESIWKLKEDEDAGKGANTTMQEKWLLKYSQPAKVKVVGVWDTVGSIGIKSFNIDGFSRSTFSYLQTGLRIHIENGYHALSIDEHRSDFEPTLWSVRRPRDPNAVVAHPRTIESVEQRWFVGAHANVGGGYEADLLAQAPLRWMIKNAQRHGLTFRSEVDLDGDALHAGIADSYKEFGGGVYSLIYPRLFRTIGSAPEVREDGSHTNVNETVDKTVFERWRADPTYRPQNLVEWSNRKGIDPATVHQTVRADDPKVSVSD
ncbi:MAG: DUF2235 domain-containing protein [Rhizobiales bacterium]|nr:DUF2235 domain-containing protein [Hyphomicrobiales bacterium]